MNNEIEHDNILDWTKPNKRGEPAIKSVGRPKGSIKKPPSRYKLSETNGFTVAARRVKSLADNDEAFESLKQVVAMLYTKMAPKYITEDGQLTEAGIARGWATVEEAKQEIIKAIQVRIEPSIDWTADTIVRD